MITVLPLSKCRGAQGIDRLAAGTGNGSLCRFGIECSRLSTLKNIILQTITNKNSKVEARQTFLSLSNSTNQVA